MYTIVKVVFWSKCILLKHISINAELSMCQYALTELFQTLFTTHDTLTLSSEHSSDRMMYYTYHRNMGAPHYRPLCMHWCDSRCWLCRKELLHITRVRTLVAMLVLATFQMATLTKWLLHASQKYGNSPVWTRWCPFRWLNWVKYYYTKYSYIDAPPYALIRVFSYNLSFWMIFTPTILTLCIMRDLMYLQRAR
jgi:hypothetical protein